MVMGDRIKRLRTEKGLTQEQLGDLVGVKRAAVNKWESGLTENLKRTVILRLSEIFEVDPSYLIAPDDLILCYEDDPADGIALGQFVGNFKLADDPNKSFISETKAAYYIDDETRQMVQEIFENPELRILFDASRKLKKEDIEAVIEITRRLKGNQ